MRVCSSSWPFFGQTGAPCTPQGIPVDRTTSILPLCSCVVTPVSRSPGAADWEQLPVRHRDAGCGNARRTAFRAVRLRTTAAGRARLDIGQPLLMNEKDLLEFIDLAPGLVVANHLEALNHCPVTREGLRALLKDRGWTQKALLPEDGECLQF